MVTYGIEQADALTAWKVWVGTGKICLRGGDAQFPAVCKGNWYPGLVDSYKSHQMVSSHFPQGAPNRVSLWYFMFSLWIL